MVSAIENWADVTGTVVGVAASGQGSVLKLKVKSIDKAEGFPNLLKTEPGADMNIVLQPGQPGPEAVGKTVTIRARLGGPDRIFAHPDWKGGN